MKESDKKIKEIIKETNYVTMFISDGILHFYYKRIDTLDLSIAKTCVKDRLEFTGKKAYPCLVNAIKLGSIPKEARDYFAKEGNDYILANAILINSPLQRMISNFYIMVSNPKNPTKLFTDKESALAWLAQFTLPV